jgi:hypothetical protein
MRKSGTALVLAAALMAFPSCGKKGPLLPPLVRIPQKIEALTLCQRGESILLEWTNPSAYMDGSPLAGISEVEIWLLERATVPGQERPAVTREQFAKEARLALLITRQEFVRHLKSRDKDKPPLSLRAAVPIPREMVNRSVFFFGLRVIDSRGKPSDFTDLVQWDPIAVPLPPAGLRTRLFEDRVEVSWEAPPGNIDQSAPAVHKGYNIYRAEAGQDPALLNTTPVQAFLFEDRHIVPGTTYLYFVRATVSEAVPYSESGDSESAKIEARDTFAPAQPARLQAVAAAGLITLLWDANGEIDLAGYRVWRRQEGKADFVLLTPQAIAENTYSDAEVEKNVRYEYAISALDRTGNESEKSEVVSEIIKDRAL